MDGTSALTVSVPSFRTEQAPSELQSRIWRSSGISSGPKQEILRATLPVRSKSSPKKGRFLMNVPILTMKENPPRIIHHGKAIVGNPCRENPHNIILIILNQNITIKCYINHHASLAHNFTVFLKGMITILKHLKRNL